MMTSMNATQLWYDAVKFVLDNGRDVSSRDGPSREVLGIGMLLIEPGCNVVLNPVRKFSPWYAAAELLWYLSGESKIERVLAYAPQYSRFAEADNTAWGSYGSRLYGGRSLFLKGVDELRLEHGEDPSTLGLLPPTNQLEAVVEVLTRNPLSRQAVVVLWEASDLPHAIFQDRRDLPCTLSMQFLRRPRGSIEELHLIVTMRSQDVWLGVPYDIWCFTSMQRIVADALGIHTGFYHHNVGSLHIYDRDREKCEAAIRVPPVTAVTSDPPTYNPCMKNSWEITRCMQEAARLEAIVRLKDNPLSQRYEGKGYGYNKKLWLLEQMKSSLHAPSVLSDAVIACGYKWGVFSESDLESLDLRQVATCLVPEEV